jgi:hypothetical protein
LLGHAIELQQRRLQGGAAGMEDLYSIHPGISRHGAAATSEASGVAGGPGSPPPPPPPAADLTELVKAQIAGHPRYPSLLSAYIDCRKVRYLAVASCGRLAVAST